MARRATATEEIRTKEVQEATARFVDLQSRLLDFYGVQAASRFVELKEPRMRAHVLEAGTGDPVLLLHGGDGEAVNWAPTMAPLQAQVRVIAADRPGCGLSDAFDYRRVDLRRHAGDFVASLLDALEIESATVVGSSMGGFFTLSAALDHPRRVRKIVLVGYPVGLIKSAPFPLKIIGGVPGLSRRFMKGRPSVEAQRDQYRTMFHVDPDTVPELFFETRIAGLQLPSEENTWADLLPRVVGLGGVRKDVYLGDEIGRIEAPALMIMGEHDMAPPQAGQAAMTRFRKGRFEYLPGIGHFPYLEAPQRTAELILEFVRE